MPKPDVALNGVQRLEVGATRPVSAASLQCGRFHLPLKGADDLPVHSLNSHRRSALRLVHVMQRAWALAHSLLKAQDSPFLGLVTYVQKHLRKCPQADAVRLLW